jgi:antirestriction protein ArdC
MKHDELKKLTDTAITRLANELDRGESATLRQFLTAMSKFHTYSISNQILIVLQRPDATQVAGFGTWKQLNRFVKKGEKGIAIIAPMVLGKKNRDEKSDDDNHGTAVVRFRVVYVFDVAQTDGEPLPSIATRSGDPGVFRDRLKVLIANLGITLEYAELNGADGVSKGKHIVIRPGMGSAEEFGVLVHELAHELLHRSECRPTSRMIREVEAEAVAFVVCDAVGISNNGAASDYITLYNGNSDDLTKCMDRIRSASATIIASIKNVAENSSDINAVPTGNMVTINVLNTGNTVNSVQ